MGIIRIAREVLMYTRHAMFRIFIYAWIACLILLVAVPVYTDGSVDERIQLDRIERKIQTGTLLEEDALVAQESGDDALYAYIQGALAYQQGAYGTGYAHFQEALSLVNEQSNDKLKIVILEKLIQTHRFFWSPDSMLKIGLEMRELASKNNLVKLNVIADIAIADIYYYLYDLDKTAELLKEAGNLSRSVDNQLGLSMYYMFLADIEQATESHKQALQYYEAALGHYENGERRGFLVSGDRMILASMAKSYAELGEKEQALASIERAKEGIAPNRQVERALMKYREADVAYSLGEYDTAIQLLNEGIKIVNEMEKPPVGESMDTFMRPLLATAYYDNGNYQEAADLYRAIEEDGYENVEKALEAAASNLGAYEQFVFRQQLELVERNKALQAEKIEIQQRSLIISYIAVGLLLAVIVLILIDWRLRRKNEKILFLQSITDHLTQVFNRARIIEIFEEEKCNESIVILMDVDDFKQINDKYGHTVGDKVLVKIAETAEAAIRESDSIGRYGGEEFLFVLRDCDLETGKRIGERVREKIAQIHWEYEGLQTTVSMGLMPTLCDDTDALLHEVDMLMYEAKRQGKNRLVLPQIEA